VEARAPEPERVFLRRIRIPPPLARAERQKVGARPRRDVGPQLDDEARRRRGADGDVEEGAGAGAGGRRGHGASEKEREREENLFLSSIFEKLAFFSSSFFVAGEREGAALLFFRPHVKTSLFPRLSLSLHPPSSREWRAASLPVPCSATSPRAPEQRQQRRVRREDERTRGREPEERRRLRKIDCFSTFFIVLPPSSRFREQIPLESQFQSLLGCRTYLSSALQENQAQRTPACG